MAITKTTEIGKIEVVGEYKAVQVRELTTIKEDDVVISKSYTNRYVLNCGKLDASDNLVDTDISSESDEVKGIANLVWTDSVKTAWKAHLIANKPGA